MASVFRPAARLHIFIQIVSLSRTSRFAQRLAKRWAGASLCGLRLH